MTDGQKVMTESQDLAKLPNLLHHIGIAGRYQSIRLPGGTNNRVYRIDAGSARFAFKVYFAQPSEERDRLACEAGFSRYAWNCGLRCIPELLAADTVTHCALFQFVEGEAVPAAAIDTALVEQAAIFCRELDRHRDLPAALALPKAADPCLSLELHVASLARRLARLKSIRDDGPAHRLARTLIAEEFEPLCAAIEARIREHARTTGDDMSHVLAASEQCISASDFGFHNALMDSRKKVTFLDFEYAGWDDPAKMIADFFGQAERPVPMAYFDGFLAAFTGARANAAPLAQRARLLLPLHRVKWAMILLNRLLPDQTGRNTFAGAADERTLLNQIDKAAAILESVAL